MINEFKMGNVVLLKSGGLPMTVEIVDINDIRTVWFDEAELKRDAFDPSELIKIGE